MSHAEQLSDETLGISDFHWQLIAESIPHIVWMASWDGRVEYINQLGNDYTGWSPGVTHNRDWLEVLHPDDVRSAERIWRNASRMGTSYTGEYRIRRSDGEYRWHVSRGLPVRDAVGEIVKWIGTATDNHDQRTNEARLRQAHRTTEEALTLLATIQAEAPVGFGFVDRDLCLVRLNQELASMTGASVEDLVGRPVPEAAPALWEQLEPVYGHVLDTGEAVRNLPTADRPGATDQRKMLASYYPVRIGTEIIGVGVVVVDVSDRLQLETALHELTRAEEFRSAVMGEVAEGVYTLDSDGRLKYMNSAASKMLGWTEFELHGKYMQQVVDFRTSSGTVVAPGVPERGGRGVFTRKDGSTFPVACSAVALRTGSADAGLAVVFRDVSPSGRSPNVIRVLIADIDKTATRSFQALLDHHEGIEVVAVSSTSASAVREAQRLDPDVVLVNSELPDVDGVTTTRRIKASTPSANVILMTGRYDDDVALASIEAGCAGVLDKRRAWVELVSAVRAAYHGETTLSQAELQRVVSKVRGGGHAGRATELTEREEEVLACMREGLSNAQVAQRLQITPNTVRNHVQRILFKLNVHSKLEAVVVTSREGLGQDRQRH